MVISTTLDCKKSEDDFFYTLWKHRFYPNGSARDVAKAWLMRAYHAPALYLLARRRRNLIAMGHQIAPLTTLPRLDGGGGDPGILKIGQETAIIGHVKITLHSDITIGSRVVIRDGVKLLTGSHSTSDPEWGSFAKPIIVQDYAWISENAIILPGVTIGRGAAVGAGSVVRSDIPAYSIALGNPARVHSELDPASLDYNPVTLVAAFEAWLGVERRSRILPPKAKFKDERRASCTASQKPMPFDIQVPVESHEA